MLCSVLLLCSCWYHNTQIYISSILPVHKNWMEVVGVIIVWVNLFGFLSETCSEAQAPQKYMQMKMLISMLAHSGIILLFHIISDDSFINRNKGTRAFATLTEKHIYATKQSGAQHVFELQAPKTTAPKTKLFMNTGITGCGSGQQNTNKQQKKSSS